MDYYYLSQDMGLTEPPIEEFSNFFAEGVIHSKNNVPNEIITFDIALLTLSKDPNLEDQKGLDYLIKFLNQFCPQYDNYKKLSDEGKERIDSILNSGSEFIGKAVRLSKCNK